MANSAVLRRLWRQCIHTSPDALTDDWLTVWAPGERLLTYLGRMPTGLLAYWLRTGRGHIVIAAVPSAYRPGLQEWHGNPYEGLCYVRSADIARDTAAVWQALLACCDHLLGSAARPEGGRLSDGVGATPRLQAVAERLQAPLRLRYADDLLHTVDAQGYLACAWQLYLTDPAALHVADPLMHRVLHDSLMNEAFWTHVLAEAPQIN